MKWVAIQNEDGTKSLVHSDSCNDYLAHHGIKGQKWGVIRFRNKAGTKRHKRTSLKKAKKSGKQKKVNSKLAKRSKDRGERNRRLQQQMLQEQTIHQQIQQQIQQQMLEEQMRQQQQILNYNAIPMFF